MASKDAAALTAVLGARAPKTAKGRRVLKKREPKIVEEAKSALIMAGNKCSKDVTTLLRDLYRLRAPLATLFMRRHAEHPFEDVKKIEGLCMRQDHGLFAFGSSSKKRPFRLILGRLFSGQLLDMQEFTVKGYRSIESFHAQETAVGSKPLMVFQGSAFESSEKMKRAKSLLLDFFSGARPEQVLLSGLDQVIVCSTTEVASGEAGAAAVEPSLSVRRFRVLLQKSGSRLPRVELEEIGPSFGLTLDRVKDPDRDRWKMSIKVPKAAKPKKVKNVATDDMGKRKGRFHMGKQDYDQIHTVHHGEAKRRKLQASLAAAAGQGGGGAAAAAGQESPAQKKRKKGTVDA